MATKAKQKLGPLQRKWLKALESGKYRRGRMRLFDKGKYCCLGVACVVMGVERERNEYGDVKFDGNDDVLSRRLFRRIGLRGNAGYFKDGKLEDAGDSECLAEMNDSDNFGFKKIAAFIRKHPEQVFRSAK